MSSLGNITHMLKTLTDNKTYSNKHRNNNRNKTRNVKNQRFKNKEGSNILSNS